MTKPEFLCPACGKADMLLVLVTERHEKFAYGEPALVSEDEFTPEDAGYAICRNEDCQHETTHISNEVWEYHFWAVQQSA